MSFEKKRVLDGTDDSDAKRPKLSESHGSGLVLPLVPTIESGNLGSTGKMNVDTKSASNSKSGGALSPVDPDKMADALYGTGVELREEEALLNRDSERRRPLNLGYNRQEVTTAPLINLAQALGYVKQGLLGVGLRLPPGQDKEFADFLAIACEEWVTPILKDVVMYSRHRRRNIRNNNSSRSEIAKALRDQSVKQKEVEEKRAHKKAQMGLDTQDGDKKKPKAEEISHRAANATAALMTSGRTKTYSWMTGGSGPAKSSGGGGNDTSNGGSGARFREARQEEVFSVRDLVRSLENRRRGVDKTLMKCYAKLKD